ncbi:hypothetical protein FKP32DRAFT_1586626 [Trametes sanguinea]|nr:hypothetical protein FKP32DRAFT_1586626 [Trametes sanguinea]
MQRSAQNPHPKTAVMKTKLEHFFTKKPASDSEPQAAQASAPPDSSPELDPVPKAPSRRDTPEQDSESELIGDTEKSFPVRCRCGVSGDGNDKQVLDGLAAIRCDSCGNWSHVSCQFHGRATSLRKEDLFECDDCDPRYIVALNRL